MKIFDKIKSLFKKKSKIKECEHDEYCPIYLSYADKYGENSKEVKYCKNSNKQYCTKYRLIGETDWKKLDKESKIKIINDINLIDFVDKN